MQIYGLDAPLYLTAFSIGFLGSTHCIAMCGGIVGVLSAGTNAPGTSATAKKWRKWRNALSYSAGRISGYALIGALAGSLGMGAARLDFGQGFPLAPVISGGFMIALGLYLSGWWRGLARLEQVGSKLWQFIRPLGTPLLSANSLTSRFALGVIWGWLPCGLVYSALALSITTGSPLKGALFMLVFGLGTLPMLLALFNVGHGLTHLMANAKLRQIAGALVILFGCYTIVMTLTGNGHHHHAPALI